jgi:tRNA modification GTPase
MDFNETIVATASAAGQGAIALIRISGNDALVLGQAILKLPAGKKLIDQQANTIQWAEVVSDEGLIDEVMVSVFRKPRSYTGEDTLEITCHGSAYIQQRIIQLFIAKGARLAQPGEYTMRAFLNGKMDLSQAEGVADLIASGSAAAHRLAVSQMRGGFSEEIDRLRNELLHFISLIEQITR